MPLITIREGQKVGREFSATLTIDNQAEYNIILQDPFDEQQERELEFYFEGWIRFPFDQQVIAQQAAQSIPTYGEALFQQIFADHDAYSSYQQACQGGLSRLQIEIQGDSPEFQSLHWEALKDPKQPRPLAVECVFTRKRFRPGGVTINLQPSPVINLLVVTARPDEEGDVGYRTISRPLIEAIQQAQLRVNVELLRPGTFEALSNHLENKEGFYHIIHFDAHGGLLTYDQFQAGVEKERYLFQARYGRSDLDAYSGKKAFLFLEGEQKGTADPVEAQELADLLTNKGIPICILNACQSGKQVRGTHDGGDDQAEGGPLANGEMDIRETSLGSRLMAAGVQMVVAMGYSVTVSAAALMMEKLYSQLFAQQGIPEAIRLGRKELYNRKSRRVYFNQTVELEDWLLPVVYANREVDLKLQELAGRERAEFLEQRANRYRFKNPTYGFVGRDLEILKIEKSLLRHNILLLRGMGGTGKTTLLNYLREWWQTTHFVKDVFYFGYDESAHTVQHILRIIGKALYPDPYEFAEFEAMPQVAQMQDVADRLRAQSYGLILDNLESVTGQELAIQNTLPEAERQQLREFLTLLRSGKTKVVLGSRSGEDWLVEVFVREGQPNIYQLGGLDPESRSVLAEKILQAQVKDELRITALRLDGEFKRLMKLLAGYPLAMEVVLANLARQSPEEILDALNAAEVDLNVGGEDKTNNILKCVEYSHSNLSPEAQKLLVCLAPFSNFIDRADLENYGKQLKTSPLFQDYQFEELDKAVQEAIQWGLLSPMRADTPRLLSVQPIFPYFLRTKLNDLSADLREALEHGFKAHYQALARQYKQMMESKDAKEKHIGFFFCGLEYENLFRALQICLREQEGIDIFFCLFRYFLLEQDINSAVQLSEFVCQSQENYPVEIRVGDIGLDIVMAMDRLAYCYVETKQYEKAKTTYQKVLETTSLLRGVSEEQKQSVQASTYHQLGMVSQALREYEQARSHYQQALDIKIEYNDRYRQASTYGQMGLLAEAQNEYDQAQLQLQNALKIFAEYQDQHSMGITLSHLARLYQTTQNEDIVTAVAQCLNISTKEVQEFFANQTSSE